MSHTIRRLPALTLAPSLLLLTHASIAVAQRPPTAHHSWEALASSGALIPTGAERTAIKDAPLSTAALSYVMKGRFAVMATIGWARTRDRRSGGDPKLDVFTYDVGTEARAPAFFAVASATFTPFMGIGVGARSYRYRTLRVSTRHNLAGYSAVGGDVGRGRVHLRFEVRDYLTAFKPLTSTQVATTRNDLVALIGLRITSHAP